MEKPEMTTQRKRIRERAEREKKLEKLARKRQRRNSPDHNDEPAQPDAAPEVEANENGDQHAN
jgi:hypothetical protein